MPALSHLRAQGGILVEFEHRFRGRAGITERHHESAFVTAGEPGGGRQRRGDHGHAAGHVLHHLGGQGVPEVRLVLQQGQPGQRAVHHRHGPVVGHEAVPADQAVRLRGLELRPRPAVGRADQLDRDAVRAQQPGELDHLPGAPVRRQVADVHHPPPAVRRSRDIRHVRRVRHHRVRPPEPGHVPVLGQDQVQVPLGHPFGGPHRRGGRGPERSRQPGFGAERGGGVLMHVPDGGGPPAPGRQGEQQLGVVDQQQVGVRAVPGEFLPGRAQGTEPAPAHRPGHRGDVRSGP
jgi:hypothetical protein